jgi:hypothetical protein
VVTEKVSREANEETMIETFKEMICKIKSELEAERSQREEADETLLKLLEETCTNITNTTPI